MTEVVQPSHTNRQQTHPEGRKGLGVPYIYAFQ